MVDIMCKTFTMHKRHLLYLFFIIYRYLRIKNQSCGNEHKVLYILSGRAAPNNQKGKNLINFVLRLQDLINHDHDAHKYMKIIYIPNYCVSIAELLIPAADSSQHISTPGTEPSGTSNMKSIMNGGLIVGSRCGSNLEIEKELGIKNSYLFGSTQ